MKRDSSITLLLSFIFPIQVYGQSSSVNVSEGYRHIKIHPASTWDAASNWCESCFPDSQLPVIRNKHEYNTVVMAMEAQQIYATWLALKKRKLKNFTWVDCQPAPTEIRNREWAERSNCVYLDIEHNHLMAGFCFSNQGRGAVCESKGCMQCHEKCDRIRGRCYIPTCTQLTWEGARANCLSLGLELAVLGNHREERKIREEMVKRWSGKPCKLFWVGLRRQEWIYEDTGHHNVTSVYWERDEPAELKGNCSIMINTTEGFRWKAVACNNSYESICIPKRFGVTAVPTPTLSIKTKTTVHGKTRKHHSSTLTPGTYPAKVIYKEGQVIYKEGHISVWFLSGAVVILIIAVTLPYFKRWYKRRKKKAPKDSAEMENLDDGVNPRNQTDKMRKSRQYDRTRNWKCWEN